MYGDLLENRTSSVGIVDNSIFRGSPFRYQPDKNLLVLLDKALYRRVV